MIKITCAKCQNVSEEFDTQAGKTVTCNQCGNVNIVPATTEETPAAPPVDQPQQETPPSQKIVDQQKDDRTWGMFCHLAALSGFLGIPFGWVLGPLVIWLIKKEDSPFIDQQGKNALNFQISMTIYFIVAGLLCLILIGFLLLPALAIFSLIMVIIATIKASDGETFEYPLSIKFL